VPDELLQMNFRPLTDAYRFSHSRKVSYDTDSIHSNTI
jgi:hypothetical protein